MIWLHGTFYHSILNTPGSSNQIPAPQNNAACDWSTGVFIFLSPHPASPQPTAHAQNQMPCVTKPDPQHKNTCKARRSVVFGLQTRCCYSCLGHVSHRLFQKSSRFSQRRTNLHVFSYSDVICLNESCWYVTNVRCVVFRTGARMKPT